MISISNAFKQALKSGDRNYQNIISITLADGTVLEDITHQEILVGGINKEDSVSEDNTFSALGSAIINSISVVINNQDESYSNYQFTGATLVYKISKQAMTVLPITIGTYTVDEVQFNGSSITLYCLDNMSKFDRPYNSGLEYPTQAFYVLQEVSTACGVALSNNITLAKYNVSLSKIANTDAVTYRDVIASIAQIFGSYAYCTPDGKLDFAWFDRTYLDSIHTQISGNTFDPDNLDLTKCHYIDSLYSQDIAIEDTVITGVQISISNDSGTPSVYIAGSSDYVISIEDNLYINDTNVSITLNNLALQLIGLKFRRCNITHVNDFTIQAGDIAVIKDRKQNFYPILITRTNHGMGNRQTTVCSAETTSKNVSTIYSKYTKNIVQSKQLVVREQSLREQQYQELANQLGSSGLFTSTETLGDGSVIYYFHNKERRQDSTVIWKMSANAFAVSTDKGATWNAGLTVDGNFLANILSATGINADWINAGALTIKDANNQVIFEVAKNPDRVIISGTAVTIGSTGLNDKLQELEDNLADYAETTDATIDAMQAQIDGQIDTYFGEYEPTMSNAPAVDWTSSEYADHIGDLFLDTNSNTSYRFFEKNGTYGWYLIADSQTALALAKAQEALGVANSKIRCFYNRPTPPYDYRDLWVQGANGDIMICTRSRASGSYEASDWVLASKYTDDTLLTNFITQEYSNQIESVLSILDTKIETWYQDTDPADQWQATAPDDLVDSTGDYILDHNDERIVLTYETDKSNHEGDFWHDTSTGVDYILKNGEWEEADIPSAVYDKIDKKAVIFTTTPEPPYSKNDLWFTGTDVLVCTREGGRSEEESFNQNDWEKKDFYTDDSALDDWKETVYNPFVTAIKSQVDGKAETWYQSDPPSTDWTAEEKIEHVGDLWCDSSTGVTTIWNGTEWEEQSVPAEVFDKIDTKAQIFVSNYRPPAPYNEHDLWFNGNIIKVCEVSRGTGETTYEADWVKQDYYTDDSALTTWVNGAYATAMANLKNQIDGKAETWYQNSRPDIGWTAEDKAKHVGDIWYDTSSQEYKVFDSSYIWTLLTAQPPTQVLNAISTKAQVWATQPSPPYNVGDLWFNGTAILYCKTAKTTGSFSTSDWERRESYTDYHNMTPYETWKQLTNDGQLQGITYDDTTQQLYINATYIHSGELDGDLIKANSINASKLNIAEGVNLYSNYDTMLQITDDTIAWKKVGVETTGTYAEFVKSPATIINGNYVQFRSTSSSGNHYILLGSAENNYGTIWVQPGYYYRISFYARTTTSGGKVKAWVVEHTSRPTSEPTSGSYNLSGQSEFSVTLNSWTRYEFNYMPPTSPNNIYYIGLGFAATVASTTINVCGIMIERLNTSSLAKAQTINTSPFESASITVIDGGNILANTITAKQIGVLGGWTIASTSLYAGNISLNAAGEKVEFNAYSNPNHNPNRTTAYIDNGGTCSFYGINGDVLSIGGDLLDDGQSGGPGKPSIYVDSQSASFYKSVNLLNATQINIGSTAPFTGVLKLSSYAAGATYMLTVASDGTVQRGSTPLSSSKRYKNHVRELTEDEGDLVYKLKPVWFKYKDEFLPEDSEIKGQALTGFYAEDILQTMPNVVYYNKKGLVENWRERELIPYLVKTIQNQKKKIDDLEKRLERLEKLLLKED